MPRIMYKVAKGHFLEEIQDKINDGRLEVERVVVQFYSPGSALDGESSAGIQSVTYHIKKQG
jgi:hypothetical protein